MNQFLGTQEALQRYKYCQDCIVRCWNFHIQSDTDIFSIRGSVEPSKKTKIVKFTLKEISFLKESRRNLKFNLSYVISIERKFELSVLMLPQTHYKVDLFHSPPGKIRKKYQVNLIGRLFT